MINWILSKVKECDVTAKCLINVNIICEGVIIDDNEYIELSCSLNIIIIIFNPLN